MLVVQSKKVVQAMHVITSSQIANVLNIVFKHGPSLLFIFVFSTNKHKCKFTKNQCEKYPYSISCWDLNPQPSNQESPPKVTRPI